MALSDSRWLYLALSGSLWLSLTPTLTPSGSYWISPCLSLALYGSLRLPLWLPLAFTAIRWLTLALSGSLLFSNFALQSLIDSLGPFSVLSTASMLRHFILVWLAVNICLVAG